jgi:hypothetical protein
MAEIIDGRLVSAKVREAIAKEVEDFLQTINKDITRHNIQQFVWW